MAREILTLTAIRIHIEICPECKKKYQGIANHVRESNKPPKM